MFSKSRGKSPSKSKCKKKKNCKTKKVIALKYKQNDRVKIYQKYNYKKTQVAQVICLSV